MAGPSETSRPREAPAAEAAMRIAPRRRTADQRLRIQERLTMGLTVAPVRRVRQIIAETLASREIDPPAGFGRGKRRRRAWPRRSPRDLAKPRRFPRRDRAARGRDGKTESPGNGAATA